MGDNIKLGIEAVVDETAATVEVGEVTTGEPNAGAAVTNSGDRYHAVLNFTIPQGEKGDKGERGDTPVKGTDYWTAEDVSDIHAYIDEEADKLITSKLSQYDDASTTKY